MPIIDEKGNMLILENNSPNAHKIIQKKTISNQLFLLTSVRLPANQAIIVRLENAHLLLELQLKRNAGIKSLSLFFSLLIFKASANFFYSEISMPNSFFVMLLYSI